ncbi:uncharacterized protein LOC122090150 [Macadamia integrifolia]|uniref:uncharacterized protein LOC122090150 n=1 Tax=Macadamia integrifolia TaxID=60698 RepID=UPI001C4F6428|nr:uncharacterized protein LOC122090150 [Macadamia integrifolia]
MPSLYKRRGAKTTYSSIITENRRKDMAKVSLMSTTLVILLVFVSGLPFLTIQQQCGSAADCQNMVGGCQQPSCCDGQCECPPFSTSQHQEHCRSRADCLGECPGGGDPACCDYECDCLIRPANVQSLDEARWIASTKSASAVVKTKKIVT